MKKRMTGIIAAAGVLIFCSGCGLGNTEENAEYTLRMAEIMPKEHPSAMASQYFADLVREKSGGRIRIQVYYNEKLGDADEILDQTRYGGIAFSRVNSLSAVEMVPSLEAEYTKHAYENPDSMMNWLENDREQIVGAFQEEELEPLSWFYPDYRCFYNATEKINDIDDFRGLKIQTMETKFMQSSMKRLAATAVTVNKEDLYRSMKTEYVNAGETSFGEFVLGDYYPLVTYVTLSNYIAAPDLIVASRPCMESMSEDDRKMIVECAGEAAVYQREQMKEFQTKYMEKTQEEKDFFLESDNFSDQLKIVLNRNTDEN